MRMLLVLVALLSALTGVAEDKPATWDTVTELKFVKLADGPTVSTRNSGAHE